MKKVKLIQILLIAILLVAMVLLTGELFGKMRPLFMKIFAIAAWAALLGDAVCTLILAFGKKNAEKKA